ncbi:MAG: tRNA (adenosine(37)-N6)-threonylcarbamoyltransferase complex transferase subunit TsaD [Bacteroidales bacterium]|nr:tRNA (adenosine(37)-N6)-threonylcarbamoyltransferase complex transferase subunit TsaD [Bacteroidales bacterium]
MCTYILGIETSCDDTSAAVLSDNRLLSNIIASQKVHALYGGVVPELASRAHQQNIIPVIDAALKNAGITKEQLSAIAFTRGPGLLGALLVGTSFAKAMALGLKIPLIEIDHLQAHVLSHFIYDENKKQPEFPFLCLTVSGGHSQIEIIKDYFDFEKIGETIDDAAGEAFDKAAKIMGLPYPGGPLVDKFAQLGNANAFTFPHPRIQGFNYSFSGLKTSFLYFVRDKIKEDTDFINNNLNDLCASIQKTIVDVLMDKLIKASEFTKIKTIAIAGGVSANSGLREALETESKKRNWQLFIPPFEFCTDNAAMVGIAGYYKFKMGNFSDQSAVPYARRIK